MDIIEAREWAEKTGKVLQGNLDPGVIMGDAKIIEEKTRQMIDCFGCQKYIANLGHWVWPTDTVRDHSSKLIKQK